MAKQTQHYIAVIGDLVDSKRITDRYHFQELFAGDLSRIGQADLASPYTLTLGDEFQALYGSARGLFYDLFAIRASIFPVRCRFSVAIGAIATPINSKQAIGMDGPAFHQARAGIERLKKSGDELHLSGLAEPIEALMTPAISLLWASTELWQVNRLRILMRELESVCPRKDKYKLEITERAIHKNIRDARLHDWVQLIEQAESNIDQCLYL